MNYTYNDKGCPGTVACEYSTDNGVTNNSMTCGDNVTGITSEEGSNIWWASIFTSCFGNATDSVSFTVDLPPTVSIITPSQGETVSLTFPFNFSALDVVGIDTRWYSFDGGANTTFTNQIDISASAGSHNLWAYANDSGGLIGSDYHTFTTQDGGATVAGTCKKTYRINEGHYPFGKFGCAIEFI